MLNSVKIGENNIGQKLGSIKRKNIKARTSEGKIKLFICILG